MYIIAGLGNPTAKYEKTRHNVGFDAIDELARQMGVTVSNQKFKALYGAGRIGDEKVILLKPQTFMNLSGEAVRAAVDFYKIDPEKELIVLYDDITLDVGHIRIRAKGSAGGHNGMKSIIQHLGTDGFKRIRIGVGDKGNADLADYVLGKFPPKDRVKVDEAIDNAVAATSLIIVENIETAQNRFN